MKIERHSQIIRLISQYDIETQEELAEKLNESGFQVTQATVSRDIRELKLTKISKPGGGSRYAVLQSVDQEMSRIYRCAAYFVPVHGSGTEYSGGKDRIRYGDGCGSCTG